MSKLFIIYDSIAQTYSEPQAHETLEAIQQYLSVVINTCSNMPLHTNSSDFTLFEIGEYDCFSGKLNLYEEKKIITSLGGLKRPCKICFKKDDISMTDPSFKEGDF